MPRKGRKSKTVAEKLIESFDKLKSQVKKREVEIEQVDSRTYQIERDLENLRQEHALIELKLTRVRQSFSRLIHNIILYMHQASSERDTLSGQVEAIAEVIRESRIHREVEYSII